MIRLLINGQEVALPDDFSSTLYEENPVFTKNEKYTYDLTLSLNNFRNARIYENINRINIKNGIQPGRSAILIVDNRVALNGTEIILGFGDSNVKIQLASGKSEFNFLIGSDKKLRKLDLGMAFPYLGAGWLDIAKKVYADLNKTYPERDWILAPYTAGYDTSINEESKVILRIGNNFTLPNHHGMSSIPETSQAIPVFEPYYSGQVPQPFLCFIIRKVVNALGYIMEYNVIEDDPIRKQYYIVHGFRTYDFAKMLPNWTVKEFFEQLELWLDLVTVVDEKNKSIRILYTYQAAEFTGKQDLNVIDQYDVDIDQSNDKRVQNGNVSYDFSEDDYYLYMRINSFTRTNAKRMNFSSLSELIARINANPEDNFEYIYTVDSPSDKSEFIAFKIGSTVTLKKIDSYKPLMNNTESDDIDIELKIVPASFISTWIQTAPSSVSEVTSDFWLQIPVAENYDELVKSDVSGPPTENPEVIEIKNVQDSIESEPDDNEDKGGTRLRLAIYDGLQNATRKRLGGSGVIIHSAIYPMAYTESLYEDLPDSKQEDYMSTGGHLSNSFRLDVINEEIYSKTEIIDTTEPYKFSFELNDRFNIQSTFIIRNREFICLKVEKTIQIDGFGKYALGYFYPKRKE